MNKLLTLFLFFSLQVIPILADMNSDSAKVRNLPLEKVYLQLDRYNFISGDDIWFKAYLTDAYSLKLFNNSTSLYVEIVSPGSTIIQRRTIALKDGIGWGDFKLGDSIPSGKYLVRAYTSWMQNFGDAFFFRKEIEIINLLGIKADRGKIREMKPDIRFFPESGSLLEDVYSEVAFKATGPDGRSIQVSGYVISSAGDTVASLRTIHQGMGSFNLLPKKNVRYDAAGTFGDGTSFRVPLPVQDSNGFVVRVYERDKDHLMVTIKTNQNTLSQKSGNTFFVLGTVRDHPCITARLKMRTLVQNILLPKDEFPEGIARITLFDSTYKPYCERLVYVHKNNPVYLSISEDKSSYTPRSGITLTLSARDSANRPVSANVSLAAVDKKLIRNAEAYHSNILTYFLLESEIKGTIERPDDYFDPAFTNRDKALDLLLLTQGWRDFIWKHLADSAIRFTHPLEKGIVISGKLRRLLVDKPIPNANISFGLFGENENQIAFTQTDTAGRYLFYVAPFFGKRTVVVSAANKNQRNIGWITLDSVFSNPAPVYSVPSDPPVKKEVMQEDEETVRRYNILRQYKLSDTIALNEVVIKGKKKVINEDDGNFRIYGTPDYSLQVTDELMGYTDVFQLLQGRVAGLFISGVYPNVSFSMRGSHEPPLFLLDGIPVEIETMATIPVSIIDKVEVIKNGAIFGGRGGNGAISVFTKRGGSVQDKPVFHSINTKLNGFYQARIFYSPKYDNPNPEGKKPDLRTTIYWNPSVMIDSTGSAKVIFFNADTPTTIQVTAEGVASSGNPVQATSEYNVIQK